MLFRSLRSWSLLLSISTLGALVLPGYAGAQETYNFKKLSYFEGSKLEIVRRDENDQPLVYRHFIQAIYDVRDSRLLLASRQLDIIYGFQWLSIDDVAVAGALSMDYGSYVKVMIPIQFKLRYQRGILEQGTLLAQGAIHLNLNHHGEVLDLKVTQAEDSWWMESVGRSLGIIEEFDMAFAQAIGFPVINTFINDPKHLDELLRLSDRGFPRVYMSQK